MILKFLSGGNLFVGVAEINIKNQKSSSKIIWSDCRYFQL